MSPALTLPLPPHNFPRMLPHAMTGPQLPSHSACLRSVSIVSTFDLMVPLLRPSCSSAILLRHPRLPLPMTPSVPIAGGSRPPLYTARWLPAVETSAPRGGKRLSVRTERLGHPNPCIPPPGLPDTSPCRRPFFSAGWSQVCSPDPAARWGVHQPSPPAVVYIPYSLSSSAPVPDLKIPPSAGATSPDAIGIGPRDPRLYQSVYTPPIPATHHSTVAEWTEQVSDPN